MEYITKSSIGKQIQKPSFWPRLVIGLTGIPGSGKSTIGKLLAAKNILVIDTDMLARQLTTVNSPVLKNIAELAGKDVILPDGSLDRALLRQLMFQNKEIKEGIESILHPEIFKLLNEKLIEAANRGVQIVVVEVPLLFEAGWEPYFDKIISVSAPEDICIKRIAQRNNITKTEAAKWLSMQMGQVEKTEKADHIIVNQGSIENLESQLDAILTKL